MAKIVAIQVLLNNTHILGTDDANMQLQKLRWINSTGHIVIRRLSLSGHSGRVKLQPRSHATQ